MDHKIFIYWGNVASVTREQQCMYGVKYSCSLNYKLYYISYALLSFFAEMFSLIYGHRKYIFLRLLRFIATVKPDHEGNFSGLEVSIGAILG